MAKIKILRDPVVPFTDEEQAMAKEFGLPDFYDLPPIERGTIIEDAILREDGEAWYMYPGRPDAPWLSYKGDYEVLDA